MGRGGQGIVTAGELLGEATLLDGKLAQSIPAFGLERRGALATCTVRIAQGEILLRCSAAAPDVLIAIDPTIWRQAPVLLGLKPDATLLFNTTRPPSDLPERPDGRVCAVDATGIPIEWKLIEDGAHDPRFSLQYKAEVQAFLKAHPREPYPRTVEWCVDPSKEGAFPADTFRWIRIEEAGDSENNASSDDESGILRGGLPRVHATRDSNRIAVRTRVEEARRMRDRALVFSNRIALDVDAAGAEGG